MPTIAPSLNESSARIGATTSRQSRWLHRALGTPVFVWRYDKAWRCVGVWRNDERGSTGAKSAPRFSPSLQPDERDEASAISKIVKDMPVNGELTARSHVRASDVSNDEANAFAPVDDTIIVLPVHSENAGGAPVVLTAACDAESAEFILEIWNIQQERDKFEQQNDTLQSEFQICAAQISDNFEELAFLRGVAEALGAADLQGTLEDMARDVLPQLKTSINAQEVILFLTDEPGDRRGVKMLRFERSELKDSVCTRILASYCPTNSKTPTIRNNFKSSDDAAVLPGIESFIIAPINKSDVVMGWLVAVNRAYRPGFERATFLSHLSEHEFGTVEAGLVTSAASMLASHGYNCDLYRQREELLVRIVRALVSAIEAKDPYTCGHSERVALYTKRLAEAVGLDDEHCERIYLSGLLHDVGKIGVCDATLQKPDKLTLEEYEEIKKHPDYGWDILCELKQLHYVLPGVVHHHERIDGAGYPDGLAGDAIPLDGRIMAVADAFDAMTSNRSYRKGMPNEEALEILRDGAGTQWDAAIVERFFDVFDDIEQIQREYSRPAHAPRMGPVQQVSGEAL